MWHVSAGLHYCITCIENEVTLLDKGSCMEAECEREGTHLSFRQFRNPLPTKEMSNLKNRCAVLWYNILEILTESLQQHTF